MTNKRFKLLSARHAFTLLACSALGFATATQAVPITQKVAIGGKEWAQVSLFTGLSWLDIDPVCPLGVCGASTLNGFDMSGWTWATDTEVGDELFKPFTSHPGGRNFVFENGDTLSGWMAATGFQLSGGSFTPDSNGFVNAHIAGITNNFSVSPIGDLTSVARADHFEGNGVSRTSFSSGGAQPTNSALRDGGAWFYRAIEDTVTVPEPATLPLLGLAGVGLAWSRRKTS